MKSFAEIAFTPAVQTLQQASGSRETYARMAAQGGRGEGLGPSEAAFITAADSFYLATVSETGWPYVQHRGGPAGFLKVIAPDRIAYAEFRGNRQYVSLGNLSQDDRVSLIVIDYPNRRRLKLLGRLRFETLAEADPALIAALALPDYRARVERVAIIHIEAFDWNCPQHITPRYTLAQLATAAQPLHDRIAQLEAEIQALRQASGKTET